MSFHVNEQAHNSQWGRVVVTKKKLTTSKSFCTLLKNTTKKKTYSKFIKIKQNTKNVRFKLMFCFSSHSKFSFNVECSQIFLRNLISFGKFISHVYSIFFLFLWNVKHFQSLSDLFYDLVSLSLSLSLLLWYHKVYLFLCMCESKTERKKKFCIFEQNKKYHRENVWNKIK
jgi:hypothetical protein